jgi:DNA-binding NarL/FixJ family response regulator
LAGASVDLSEDQHELLRLMTEARSDAEIASSMGISEAQVAADLDALLVHMNAPSRAAATAFALTQRLV